MQRSFKCCKNKEFSNFCCVVCCGVFHPSCMDRCSEIIRISGYKIFCSSDCQSTYNDRDNQERVLKLNIETLNREILQRDDCIRRLKRGSQVSEDVVPDGERSCSLQLDQLNKRNSSLIGEVQELKRKEVETVSKLESLSKTKHDLEMKMKELTDLNKSLLVSVETLEKDNETYFHEIKQLRNTVFDQENKQSSLPFVNKVDQKIPARHRKPQLLMVGNRDDVIGCSAIFKKHTKAGFDINCQYASGLLFEEVVENSIKLSGTLTKNDYVIVFAGCENALKYKPISPDSLTKILYISIKTNVIVVGAAYAAGRKVLNGLIYENNMGIHSFIHKNRTDDLMFVPMDGFMQFEERSWHCRPSYPGKRLLCGFIANQIILMKMHGKPQHLVGVTVNISESEPASAVDKNICISQVNSEQSVVNNENFLG